MLGGNYAGGGFLDTNSQNSPSKRQNAIQQTLRPVTIKQLVDAEAPHPDSNFRLDNAELQNILAVGCIRGVKQSTIGTTYTIEDGTSSIDAVIWTKKEGDSNAASVLSEGSWVKISGSLKSYNNKKSINCSSLTAIVDFNEVTFHFLSAVNAHLYYTKGPLFFKPTQSHQSYGQPPLAQQQYSSVPQNTFNSGFSPVQAAVFGVFRECNSMEGLNVHSVVRRLTGSFPEPQLRDAVRYLIEEGHLYSTIDDDHAKCTS